MYLGIMLDSSFTLREMGALIKTKATNFCSNVSKFYPRSFPVSLRVLSWKVFIKSLLECSFLSFSVLGLN